MIQDDSSISYKSINFATPTRQPVEDSQKKHFEEIEKNPSSVLSLAQNFSSSPDAAEPEIIPTSFRKPDIFHFLKLGYKCPDEVV